jgi:dihydroflavonol-4-reductase
MADSPVLVTGISGFIAKHCALELLSHGYRVRGTVRSLERGKAVRETLSHHVDVSKLDFVEADLTSDRNWDTAMRDVKGVQHLASPFPIAEPKDPQELIRPAVEGTLRVLKAAAAAGVPRVVQTSSTAAVYGGQDPNRPAPFTADDWTDVESPRVDSYSRSKTLAERAARDFVATVPQMHFSTINPGFVLGPVLDRDYGTSAGVIASFLRGKYPGAPKISFPVVDVRDVAKAHRLAFESDLPSGGRYLCVSETAWFIDMMRPIKARLGTRAKKVPGFELPSFAVRFIGLFDAGARRVAPELGRFPRFDASRTREALGMSFIPVTQSAPDMAESLLAVGID